MFSFSLLEIKVVTLTNNIVGKNIGNNEKLKIRWANNW